MAVPLPGCEHNMCRVCWAQWLAVSSSCPVCKKKVSPTDLMPSSRTVWSLLCKLVVHCDYWDRGCNEVMNLESLRKHTLHCHFKHSQPRAQGQVYRLDAPHTDLEPQASRPVLCQGAGSAAELAVADVVMSAALTQPISPIEDRLLGGLLRRLSYQQGSTTDLSIFTGGRRRLISYVPAASRGAPSSSESVSVRTMQRRQRALENVGQAICGGLEGSQAQQQFRTTRLSQAERETMVVNTRVQYYVRPDQAVALATKLRLSNAQMRKLRAWTKQWNLHIASERQTRQYTSAQMGEVELDSEMVQVVGGEEDGARHFRSAPFAWVKNPIRLLQQHFQSLQKRSLLTWHQQNPGMYLAHN